jgi:hypothetical protein
MRHDSTVAATAAADVAASVRWHEGFASHSMGRCDPDLQLRSPLSNFSVIATSANSGRLAAPIPFRTAGTTLHGTIL